MYKNGAGIGPDRIKSINYLETPKTRKKLESFLEMINYCSKFIINLCKEIAYLYGLIKKKRYKLKGTCKRRKICQGY